MSEQEAERILKDLFSLSRTFFDLQSRYESHLARARVLLDSTLAENVCSFYMVDYDISEGKVLFSEIPIFIEDEQAIKTWLFAFYIRNELKLNSFATAFFDKMPQFPNVEFILSERDAIYQQRDGSKIEIEINRSHIEGIDIIPMNWDVPTEFIHKERGFSYVNYADIDRIASQAAALENRDKLSTIFRNLSSQFAGKSKGVVDNNIVPILAELFEISLVLFIGIDRISSFIIIPATTWKTSGKEESSGGFLILFRDGNRITPAQEYSFTAIANSWFKQISTNDLVKAIEKRKQKIEDLQRIFQRMDHDISRHLVERISRANIKKRRKYFADYLERRVKLMRKFSGEVINENDLPEVNIEALVKSINRNFEFNKPSIAIKVSGGRKSFMTYEAALELIFENLLINTHEANDEKAEVEVRIGVNFSGDGMVAISYEETDGIGFKNQIKDKTEDDQFIQRPIEEKIADWKKCKLSKYDLTADDRGMGIGLINMSAELLLSGNYDINLHKSINDRRKASQVINVKQFGSKKSI